MLKNTYVRMAAVVGLSILSTPVIQVALPAQAAMRVVGSACRSHPGGQACVYLEADSATGRIRARGTVDSSNGTPFTINWVEMDRVIDYNNGGEQVILGIAENPTMRSPSTGAPVSSYTGTVGELCDQPEYIVTWRARFAYFVGRLPGAPLYTAETTWRNGTC